MKGQLTVFYADDEDDDDNNNNNGTVHDARNLFYWTKPQDIPVIFKSPGFK